jgi:hemoglobin
MHLFRDDIVMDDFSEEQIAELVDRFYARVRADEALGPIFKAAIGDEWTSHLARMRAFWSSVMLASRTYKGNPMVAHLNLPRLTREHFDRWLEMWRQTAGELCSSPAAEQFISKAEMIAERLLGTISLYHQPPPTTGSSLSSSH